MEPSAARPAASRGTKCKFESLNGLINRSVRGAEFTRPAALRGPEAMYKIVFPQRNCMNHLARLYGANPITYKLFRDYLGGGYILPEECTDVISNLAIKSVYLINNEKEYYEEELQTASSDILRLLSMGTVVAESIDSIYPPADQFKERYEIILGNELGLLQLAKKTSTAATKLLALKPHSDELIAHSMKKLELGPDMLLPFCYTMRDIKLICNERATYDI